MKRPGAMVSKDALIDRGGVVPQIVEENNPFSNACNGALTKRHRLSLAH